MSATLIFIAIASGAFIGAVLGLIGAGGAMVSVPILLYLFDFSPLHATTAALAVVFLAALAGVGPKFKSKDVLIKEAVTIWALGLVTNIGQEPMVLLMELFQCLKYLTKLLDTLIKAVENAKVHLQFILNLGTLTLKIG